MLGLMMTRQVLTQTRRVNGIPHPAVVLLQTLGITTFIQAELLHLIVLFHLGYNSNRDDVLSVGK